MGAISNRVSGGLPLRAAIIHALPAILYGVRIAASASIALYIAFFLQMDQPSWAGTTAVIVAQPALGAALRKGVFRLIGTLAGAIAAVALVALFPQSRIGFFLSRDSLLGQRNGHAFTVEVFDGRVDGFVECGDVGEGLMGEMMRLEVMPDDFDVVEFGRVFGQPLDGEPVGAGGEGRQREFADVDRPIVLDKHDRLDR